MSFHGTAAMEVLEQIEGVVKALDAIIVADTKAISQLCANVQRVVAQESTRTELVRRIVAIAKLALRAC
jgi:acyl-CoA reductase-like NAD-dependent aldehyde dehydrogenase